MTPCSEEHDFAVERHEGGDMLLGEFGDAAGRPVRNEFVRRDDDAGAQRPFADDDLDGRIGAHEIERRVRLVGELHAATIPDRMRRLRELTLIVTDGHAPAELTREALASVDRMPSAERLMARGTRIGLTADWSLALLRAVGATVSESQAQLLALAPLAWLGLTGQRDERMWFATPVQLTAATDHVRLDALAPHAREIADGLAAEFRREFSADGLILHMADGPHWLLEVPRTLNARTVDPGRLIGNDVGRSLPDGADGAYLRKLMTEVQMWLHGRTAPSAGFNGL